MQKVCCYVVKLISFEIYEQDAAKKAAIEDYLANFVITINNNCRITVLKVGQTLCLIHFFCLFGS